ncbi:shewanella-like protein phosphatase 2 [Juglans microcarpa x Juglans regia]|uniref:shewanella-like protein phosphatase 2 n=1 Tax=Juglans microcarpa x Juglans regia TaxID=2249226 RepID=UPI001B7F0924|nr:shewanella-like protein phosphatase 2 [Juglans microcarpa x Juglans regia]
METNSKSASEVSPLCKDVPKVLSSFVDTFVDFSVSGGLFLPQDSPPNPSSCQNPPADSLFSPSPPPPPPPLRTLYPNPPDRLVAIGDLHGDLEKSKEAFRLANLIDRSDRWIGGSSTVVQIGDVLDRGGDELKILYFLEKLKRQAARSGGTLITMNGNHEIMNVEGDFRFVTKSGLDEFRVWADWYRFGQAMKGLCKGLEKPEDPFDGVPLFRKTNDKDLVQGLRARVAALRPHGPISSRFLSQNVTVLVVGDSVFVHGGLLPVHVSYGLEKINEEVRDWIKGLGGQFAPAYCRTSNAVVWLRSFSHELAKNCDCSTLERVLATIPGTKRMIMGHTIQKVGINGVCNNQAIRIDVGMSKGCINGLPEVLEITGNSELRILTSNPRHDNNYRASLHKESKAGLGLLIPEHGPKQVEVKA